MNVYMISGDGDYFGASFERAEQNEQFLSHERDGLQIPPATVIEGCYFPEKTRIKPVLTDFGWFTGGISLLLHRPRTDVLRPMLERVGMILPMTPWRGRCFEAFVCEAQIDAIDDAGMEYYPDDHPYFYGMIRRFAFKAEAVAEATVFRVEGRYGRLYATDRFLDVVQAHGLTGLQVKPLWSSETGPIGFIEDAMMEFERYPPGFGSTPQEKRAAMRAILARRDDASTA